MSKDESKTNEKIPDMERRRILKVLRLAPAVPVVTVLFAGSRDAWAAS